MKYGIPLPDSCADFVYSSHMLHYLYCDPATNLPREVLRVLERGGTIRLSLPDRGYIFSLHQQDKREQAIKVSSSNFPRFDRNHNTGHDLFADSETRPALQSVMHQSGMASYLTLPVIPASR
jgi:predicted SAM-dependent methyltransferase